MLQQSGEVLGKCMGLEQCQNNTGTGECQPPPVSVSPISIFTMLSGLEKINSPLSEILKLTQVFVMGLIQVATKHVF